MTTESSQNATATPPEEQQYTITVTLRGTGPDERWSIRYGNVTSGVPAQKGRLAEVLVEAGHLFESSAGLLDRWEEEEEHDREQAEATAFERKVQRGLDGGRYWRPGELFLTS